MTTLMIIYELHLLIFKMSNESSYCEAYKRLLTPHIRSIPSKRKIFSSSHSLFLSFILLTFLLFDFFPNIYIYIIKIIHTHLFFYLSHIYSHFTTLIIFLIIFNFLRITSHQHKGCYRPSLRDHMAMK